MEVNSTNVRPQRDSLRILFLRFDRPHIAETVMIHLRGWQRLVADISSCPFPRTRSQ